MEQLTLQVRAVDLCGSLSLRDHLQIQCYPHPNQTDFPWQGEKSPLYVTLHYEERLPLPPPLLLCGHRGDWVCSLCARCPDCCTHGNPDLVHVNTKAAAIARHREAMRLREENGKSSGSGGGPTPS